jgi:cobalt-zinc-cadmium efflux system outer membrane protein
MSAFLATGCAGHGSFALLHTRRARTEPGGRSARGWLGSFVAWVLLLGNLLFGPAVPSARGQITSLADDIIILSAGVGNQEQQRADAHLGTPAGSGGNPFGYSPGSGDPRLGPQGVPGPGGGGRYLQSDVLEAAAGEPQFRSVGSVRTAQWPAATTQLRTAVGALAIPDDGEDDEGPPDGLTLDAAINQLVRQNYDLRTKWMEIPQARADVLTASLRANPLVFASASSIPYGSYSAQRPGQADYSATVIYPVDVSHKRAARTEVACEAQRVLEAQYQDAVRLAIDRLYLAYLDVITARETLRYTKANRDGLLKVYRLAHSQLNNQRISGPDFDRVGIQLDSAEISVEQAQVTLRESLHMLGLMLAMPLEQAEQIQLFGTIHDTSMPPPAHDELLALARSIRPDLVAYRLGVRRAGADVQLAEAEKTSDVFFLYTPYDLRNNTPTGGQNATSWSVAAFGSVPLFNRNQGNIRRAQLNVTQTRIELAGLEQQVNEEVHGALAEYLASRDTVNRLEESILPRSKRIRDGSLRLLEQGETSTIDYLAAQREYNDIVRQYRDALVRHRRSMLRLNTAVGRRIFP